jgi:hypothetical protein
MTSDQGCQIFLIQYIKTGINYYNYKYKLLQNIQYCHKIKQMATNGHKIYQNFPFKGLPKSTKNGDLV